MMHTFFIKLADSITWNGNEIRLVMAEAGDNRISLH